MVANGGAHKEEWKWRWFVGWPFQGHFIIGEAKAITLQKSYLCIFVNKKAIYKWNIHGRQQRRPQRRMKMLLE